MPRPPQYSDEELLETLRELASKLDRTPRKKDMNEYGSHAARTYQLRFGSWNDAVRDAGFEPRPKGAGYGERPDAWMLLFFVGKSQLVEYRESTPSKRVTGARTPADPGCQS